MKTVDQLVPNYAPVYAAALYPELCKLFQKNGYALAVHGSLAKDLDLIAVPWVGTVTDPVDVVEQIKEQFTVREGGTSEIRAHGRLVFTLCIGFGDCSIDLSFFPYKGS